LLLGLDSPFYFLFLSNSRAFLLAWAGHHHEGGRERRQAGLGLPVSQNEPRRTSTFGALPNCSLRGSGLLAALLDNASRLAKQDAGPFKRMAEAPC
jgi:hypothetical protein